VKARSTALNAGRVVAVLVALALLLVTPAMIETPNGRSYEPLGIAIDVVALIVLVAVAWSVLRDVGAAR
jgi:hypothetical protein